MGTAQSGHQPVLLERVVALLAPALDLPGAVLVDATLGRAGHARALLDAHPGLVLVGLDTDAAAIEESGRLLAGYGDRVRLTRAVYDQIATVLARLGLSTVQGVLFDLGVSSPQLDERDRGFAYSYDAPLDMRMDQEQPLTAAETSTPTRPRGSPGSCASTAKSGSPARSQTPSCASGPAPRCHRPGS
jgi:16S rRNA (cytosine1402-N4)-methyltransferase